METADRTGLRHFSALGRASNPPGQGFFGWLGGLIGDVAQAVSDVLDGVSDWLFGVGLAPGTPTLGNAPTHDYLYDPHPGADNSAYEFARKRGEALHEWGGHVQEGVGYVEGFYLTVGAGVVTPRGLHTGKQGKHIPGHNNSMPGRKTQFPPGTTMEDVEAIFDASGAAARKPPLGKAYRDYVTVGGRRYAIQWDTRGTWHIWPLGLTR